MDEKDLVELKICQKCIDDHDMELSDHEQRLREIERNNKMPAQLKLLEDKVWLKFEANEKAYTSRLDLLEKFVTANVAVIGVKSEEKHDTFSLLSIIVSLITLGILILSKVI